MAGASPAEFHYSTKGIARLAADLASPKRLLKTVGLLLVAQGQEAFKTQSFGAFRWKPRYSGGIGGKYLNVAGVISDAEKGGAIKSRRTADRVPALVDTGLLRKSLTSISQMPVKELGAFAVEYGTNVKYAGIHQTGGISFQRVSPTAIKKIGRWLAKQDVREYYKKFSPLFAGMGFKRVKRKGKAVKVYKKMGILERVQKGDDIDEERELSPRIWATKVHKRPFVGITDKYAKMISSEIARLLAKGDGRDASPKERKPVEFNVGGVKFKIGGV